MARTINEQEYAVKRNEILDATQRLVYTKGYEQMTVRDILDALKISKGAFYHYFASKQALLEGLIERTQREGEQLFAQILSDPALPPLEQLQHFFDAAGRWKTAQKAYLLALLRVWYTDDNAIVRQKVQAHMLKHASALLTQVIVRGHAEGAFTTPFPDQAGAIVMQMLLGMGEAFAALLLMPAKGPDLLPCAERLVAAYNDALERVLGAPSGSLSLLDAPTLREWFAIVEL